MRGNCQQLERAQRNTNRSQWPWRDGEATGCPNARRVPKIGCGLRFAWRSRRAGRCRRQLFENIDETEACARLNMVQTSFQASASHDELRGARFELPNTLPWRHTLPVEGAVGDACRRRTTFKA